MSQRAILRHLLNVRAGFDEVAASSSAPSEAHALTLVSQAADSHSGTIWRPTRPSEASRRPTLRGRGSVRGTLVDQASGRELVFESRLERGLAEMLLARRDVSHIADQPPAVRYMTPDGRTRRHTFDFLVTTVEGGRLAIAVKPEAKVERSGIQATLSLIRAQIGSRFADAYLLRTDRHITRDRVFNAQLLLRSRVCRIEADVAAIWTIAETLPGSFTLADIVARAGIGARGFNAVICLIDDGLLEPGEAGKIDYLTHLRRAAAK